MRTAQELGSEIEDGRTGLVFDLLATGQAPTADLMRWCAYYGDASAIRHLMAHGAKLGWLGDNLDLNGASFHGHRRLCQFLLENGALPNCPLPGTGETPSTIDRLSRNLVMRVLLANVMAPIVSVRGIARWGGICKAILICRAS